MPMSSFLRTIFSCLISSKRGGPRGLLQRLLWLIVCVCTLGVAGTASAAMVDLSVSAYLQTPDPVSRGGKASFSVVVTNNEDLLDATGTVRLAVELPVNVNFASSTAPSGCAFNLAASPQLLNCTRSGLGKTANWTINFSGAGSTASAVVTKASVSFANVDTDGNNFNNDSIKTVTVIKGADLSVATSGTTGLSGCPAACTAQAGATVGYRVDVANAGPDSASQFKVTYNLPASADFTYASASGTGWTCTHSGTVLTCTYNGAAIGVGQQAPPITIGGRIVKSIAGTITNGASVASSDLQTGDPEDGNNGPSQVIVTVKQGTDLDARQTLVSNASGLSSLTAGEAVSLNLWAVNSGTQDASGVTVKTTVSSDFIIGTLPTGCAKAGRTITCSVGALAHGITSSKFLIPLTVAAGATGGANVVDVARSAPLDGLNNPASATYTIVAPFAHLTLTKSKSPGLVAANGLITNTITVTNANTSTSAASGTVTVTDTLSSQESYVSASGTGWTCSAAGQLVTCTYTIPGSLARGAKLPALVLTTRAQAGFTGTLSNTACTGMAAGSAHQPPDNVSTGNCATASVTSTPLNVDLAIVKTASLASLPAASNTFSYTLVVSNAGPDSAPTVKVVDALPHWYSRSGTTTGGSAVLDGSGAGESCSFASTVNCTLRNLGKGASRTITITLNRPLKDGALLNTAKVSSPDAIDTNAANNSSGATVTVVPQADVGVTAMAGAPNPVRVGVPLVYTTSIRNNGPSSAANVVLRQVIDPARMAYVAGSASIAGSAAQCTLVPAFSGAPYAGQSGIECQNFALSDGETRQLIFSVIPVFPYPDALDATYISSATISTTTDDSNAANDSNSTTVTVISKELDLSVSAIDTGYEQSPFGDALVYQVSVQNNGPSLATGLKLVVTPVPPPQNGVAVPYTMLWNSAGSTLPAGASCSQPGGAGTNVVCYLASSPGGSTLASGVNRVFGLKFDTGPVSNAPLGSITYKISASVESLETGAAPFTGDKLATNNVVEETTTVLPKTDLILVSKTVSPASPFSINQPFTYTLVVGNLGPALAASTVVTDVLPAGFVLTAAPTARLGSGAPLALNNCVSSGSPVTVTCTLGVLPIASGAADTANLVVITIPVKAPYPAYAGPFASNITNTASIVPTPGTSRDPNAGNNSSSVDVQIVKSSITGSVYNDANRSNSMDAGEKITSSVTFSLYGQDFWGNDIGTAGAPLTLNTSSGDFLFDRLPRSAAGGYTLVETQPANYADLFEVAGTAGGTPPPASCDGGVNCSASAAHNTISQIVLAPNTAATGYLFQEYAHAAISGYVYADKNNNGLREAGESGIAGVQVKLSGQTFWGADVCAAMGSACTATTDANGKYSFINVPPSRLGESYTLTELAQPAGYADGKEQNGAGNVVANSAGRAAPEGIVVGSIEPGLSYTERNFGELALASIAGSVYMDSNRDAVRQGGESTGVAGVTLTLSGNDYLGHPVCPGSAVPSCTFQTGADGSYLIAGLAPSDATGYAVTVTPPASLYHTGAQAGSLGGLIDGAVRVPGTGVSGAAIRTAGAIVLLPGTTATGYHFGQAPGAAGGVAQSLSGYVYVDANRNGRKDAGETGIAGVTVTLSGTTADGFDVCSVIVPALCTLQTAADGAYSFTGLPQSDSSGYTVVEIQPAAYLDGAESVGTVNGVATGRIGGSAPRFDQFSGIVLPHGGSARDYNFGELTGSIAGKVYLDVDGNGSASSGDTPLAGVTLTLTGGAGGPVTVLTDANGAYHFDGLLAGSYTVTQTQPLNYADAGQAAGNGGGNASVVNVVSAIALAPGAQLTGYDFGEKTGAISGAVYVDANDNGVRDTAETTGIAGVSISLTGIARDGVTPVNRTVITAADGSYSFGDLPNANAAGYTLVETQPAAYLDGRHRKGLIDGAASCANPACDIGTVNAIARIPFDAAKSHTRFDFGELLAASISGRVYGDANDSGSYEKGEGLPGVSLTLSGIDSHGKPVNVTVVTDADGSYTFPGLYPSGPGGYTVTETQPADLGNFPGATGTFVGSINGKPVGTGVVDVISAIVLPPQGNGSGYDFREQVSSLRGFVYRDLNDNGAMDAGEAGIAEIEITLRGANGFTRTVVTGSDGSYRFDGLPAGTYSLLENQPAVYLDGRETAGSAGGKVNNARFGAAPEHNTISDIVLPVATQASGYLFGERHMLGKLGGVVYADLNNDGVQNDGEQGIAGVTVVLSGISADGKPVKLSLVTGADGSYLFDTVPVSDAAGYTLTETQPAGYVDGKTVVLPGSVGSANASKPVGVGNKDTITGIKLAAGDDMRGYLFGEKGIPQLKPPVINGYVWLNYDGSRVRPLDGSQAGVAGWTAELHQEGKLICRAITDEKGFYQFDNLHCPGYEASGLPTGSGYAITFLKDGNNMPNVPVSTGGEGVVVPGGSRITSLTLRDGDRIVEQNLPLDPAGVVYDSVTRKPVAGAVVSINGPAGFDSTTHLVGGVAEQTQTVGSDGMYQFLLQNDFPSGVYTLSVVAPANYLLAPSGSLPACKGPLTVGLVPNPAFIQASELAPALSTKMELDPNNCAGLIAGGARTTQYYLSFVITNGGSAPILNNHIPLDPLGSDSIMVTKTTPMLNVTRGDLVPYTITASNPQAATLGAMEVRDLIPAGFKYRVGSATRNGVPAEPVVDGRSLRWKESGFAPKEKKTYKLMLMVGSGVGDGEYVNQAWAATGGTRISNLATATVRVVPDATFDCPDILGKVFDDQNANGYQDEGEAGIAGVRMATARGLLVTTDAEGRFHVACPAIPNADRGSNFVMKLDDRTLPSGYRVTTENPRDVRLTRGKVVKLNFGATIHRVVRLELSDAAFVAGETALQAEWAGRIEGLVSQLRAKPSVLRIAYAGGDDAALAQRRSKAIESEMQARWQALQNEYPLVIEIEGAQ